MVDDLTYFHPITALENQVKSRLMRRACQMDMCADFAHDWDETAFMASAIDILTGLRTAILASETAAALGLCDQLGEFLTADHKEALRSSGRIQHLETLVKQLKAQIKERDERIARLTHELWAKKAENFEPKDGPAAEDDTSPDGTGQGDNVPDEQKSSDGCGCCKSPKNYAADPQKPKKASTGRGPTDWSCFDHFTLKYIGPKTCPCGCGGLPRSFNPEKRLHCRPVYYWVNVTYVPKFRCRYDQDGEERMKTMPFTPTLLPGTNISSSVLAYHATQRYAWGLPWYRIETMMRYAGWMVYRSTLMKRANKTAEAIMGVYYALMESVLGDSIRVFVDETPIPILRPGKGKTGTAYFFAVHRDDRPFSGNLPPATLYASRNSRAGHHVHDLFAGRSLIAHHDGYGGYGKFGKVGSALEKIISVGCWTHSRRNFIKYYETTTNDGRGSASAAEIIEMIDLIYKYDAETWGWSPEERRRHRQEYCKPIIDKLRRRLDETKSAISTGSTLTTAINYVLNRWDSLTRFLNDGRLELDTNAVERQFKPIQNLRKNVYFMGSDEGGQTWAVFSSLIETCKLNGVDPYKYLVWLFDELALLFARGGRPAIDFRKFLPWNAPEKCAVGFKAEDEGIPKAA